MIFNIFNFILSIIGPIIFGLVLINLILPRTRFYWLEFLVIGYGLGAFVITWLMFILSWLGLNLSTILNILFILLAASLILIFKRCRQMMVQQEKMNLTLPTNWLKKLIVIILVLIIILKLFLVFSGSYLRPIIQYDALATWSLKAKIFWSNNKIIFDQTNPYFLGYHLPGYPLHLPLLEVWQASTFGRWHDGVIKIIFPIYYLGLLVLLGANLRRQSSLLKTIVFVFFLASLPLLIYHSRHDYADLILAFYLLATTVYTWRAIKEGNYNYGILASIFAVTSAWTKNEGFFLALIIIFSGLVYLLAQRKLRFRFLIPVSIFIILLLPWLIFKIYHHLGWENFGSNFQLIFQPAVLKNIFNTLTSTINWNIWWLVFVLGLAVNWRRVFARENLFLVVIGSLIFYLFLYVFTPNADYIASGLVDQRNLLTIIPLTIFYIGLLFSNQSVKINL